MNSRAIHLLLSALAFFTGGLKADLDWGGGNTQFTTQDNSILQSGAGLAVLVAVTGGDLVDLTQYRPEDLSDLVHGGRIWTQGDRTNVVLAVSEAFDSGYLFNATLADVTRNAMQSLGVGSGDELHLVVWDQTTLVDGVPVASSRFTTTPLTVTGVNATPAVAFGALLPDPPSMVYPDETVVTLAANSEFAGINQYSLTVGLSPLDGGAIDGPGTFDEGTVVGVSATPSEGYRFVNWSGAGFDEVETNPLSVTLTESISLVANFVRIWELETSVASGEGEVTGGGVFDDDTDAVVTAMPAAGYRFVAWQGEGVTDPLNPSTTVGMTEARQVAAQFELITNAPNVESHPVSQTVLFGESVTFAVSASGVPAPSFQWFKGDQEISGAVKSSLTLAEVTLEDAGDYRVVVKNEVGSVTSGAATLTVWVFPSILVQPVGQTVVAGETATLSVSATGVPVPSYQWRKDGVEVPGVKGSSLTIEAAELSDAGAYDVVITNVLGSVTSTVATVSVRTTPVIESQPESQTVEAGENITLAVRATGVPAPTYQWRKDGVILAGEISAELSIVVADLSDAGDYDVVVANEVDSVISTVAKVSVHTAPAIVSQPESQTVVAGETITLSVAVTGVPAPTYQWRKGEVDLVGEISAELSIPVADLDDAGDYDVVVANEVDSVTSIIATVLVHAAPVIASQPESQTVETGETITLSVEATGVPTPTYQWRKGGMNFAGETSAELSIQSADLDDAGDYDVVVTNVVDSVTSKVAKVSVHTAPVIVSQPESRTVEAGSSVTFTVDTTGVPAPAYQWRKDGVVIDGATTRELTVSAVSLDDAGDYDVVVSNLVDDVVSSLATLTVHTLPQITVQPTGRTVVAGDTATFTVEATGVPAPTYRWRKDGVDLPGENSADLTLVSVELSDAATYDVTVSNVVGEVLSQAAELTVHTAPRITTEPLDQTVIAGETVILSVQATGVPTPTYQWRKDGVDLNGATSTELSIPSAALDDAGDYDVVVTNVVDSVTSTVATVSVHVAPSIASQPKSQTVLAGENVTLSVEATGVPEPTYQWRKGGVAIAGATESTFVITSAQAEDAGDYDVVVSNVVDDVTSGTATLTVRSVPEITTQPISQTVISGESISFVVEATGLPSPTFQWRKDGIVIVDATDATYTIGVATADDAGAYDVVVSNTAGEVNSKVATLMVNSLPSIVSQPEGVAALAGTSVELNVTADGADPLSYQWRKDGGDISGANAATFSIPSVGLDDAGAYDVRVSNEFGSVISDVATVSVVELMGVHSLAEGGYQAGQTITVNNTITYAGSLGSFGWSVIPPATIDGQAWDFASSGAGAGQVSPLAGDADLFEWAWTSNPSSPIEFSYTVNVPDNAEGDQELTAILRARIDGQEVQSMVTPDPLVISPAPSTHSADTDMDSKLSLSELLRVIELYNYREGTRRTGAYQPDDSTADGFAAGPGSGTPSRYHSADFDQSGSLSLSELLRVIELYNYREGTRRTGEYHADGSTVDGFAAGPEVSD